ncbi:MAG: HD domain-containing protein [Candidatus Omnitrophica bacterium]|nr:HD domain-containing protein [Candidatus Omnitrophota bacterium]
MRKMRFIFSSFCVKVIITLILSIFFVMALSSLLVYKFALDSQFHQLRERLKIIASTAALMVDAESLKQVPLNAEGINSPAYLAVAAKLKKIKEVNPTLKYIYTMARTDDPRFLQFVVDPDPMVNVRGKTTVTSYPGDRYDTISCPDIIQAFDGPAADKKLVIDDWGVFLSGYAPVHDKSGRAQYILGVDMAAQDIYALQGQVSRRVMLVLGIGFLMSVLFGLFISFGITSRIRKLVEGTRRIAAEDLEYKVEVKGHDEISELASSFNLMATSLSESKGRLQDYFYRVVQSLVRILEAKDAYTKGHSDRVANYAQAIALNMGFAQNKVELVRKAAQLHDIGKLAVHEGILNKKEALTEEEWRIIKEHPIIGEEVLKPVLLDEEMLSMVRSHHERYDGGGYPDKIKGDAINIFAQIISVADAYDAMTSPRAYREARDKEKAITELKNNSGSQFNTQVVKAFLKVLAQQEKEAGK